MGGKLRRNRAMRQLLDSLVRLRHFRGHGVHSPYIYNIVRRVFMHKGLIDSDNYELYDRLISCTDIKIATELQNITTICEYTQYHINPSDTGIKSNFIIWTSQHSIEMIRKSMEMAKECGATIAVIYRGINRDFEELEREIMESHRSTIIKKRGYLLIFNNHLPKQRFTL